MKKIYLFISFLLVVGAANAQTYVSEDFTSSTFPPTGWSIDAHSENWSHKGSNNANGKNAGEAEFDWNPKFNGYTRLISPIVDLSGVTSLSIEFNHMLDYYGGSGDKIGVATRSDNGDWNTVWETNATNIAAEHKIINITTSDVGSSDFQFCFYFHGNSYDMNDWYLDDIRLFTPYNHDVATLSVNGETYFNPNSDYTPEATLYNYGMNSESFRVACTATTSNGDVAYTDTIMVNDLAKGEFRDVSFATFALNSVNDYYNIEVTTLLSGDMDNNNDLNNKYIYTYDHERDMVLVEIGTGTGCPYCPGAAMGADDLVAEGKPVAIIEYHNYNADDPFKNDAAAARTGYYGVTGYPTAVFDGQKQYVGGSNNQSLFSVYEPLVDERTPVRVGMGIQFTTQATARGFNVLVTVIKYGPVMGDNFVLHFAVTESEIAYNWQGQTKLDFVERLMLPDANGTPIDIANNSTIEQEYEFEVGDDWNVDELEVVAFIQNTDSKEIMNGHKEMLKYVGVSEINANDISLSTYPNPVTESATISFNLNESAHSAIDIFTLQGQKVSTLINKNLSAGKHHLTWTPDRTVSNGIYIMKASIGEKVFSQKIAIQR